MDPIVDILVDGKPYAIRNWREIPRVGDIINLKNGEVWGKVHAVVWSDDTACHHTERQWIQLLCTTTPAP